MPPLPDDSAETSPDSTADTVTPPAPPFTVEPPIDAFVKPSMRLIAFAPRTAYFAPDWAETFSPTAVTVAPERVADVRSMAMFTTALSSLVRSVPRSPTFFAVTLTAPPAFSVTPVVTVAFASVSRKTTVPLPIAVESPTLLSASAEMVMVPVAVMLACTFASANEPRKLAGSMKSTIFWRLTDDGSNARMLAGVGANPSAANTAFVSDVGSTVRRASDFASSATLLALIVAPASTSIFSAVALRSAPPRSIGVVNVILSTLPTPSMVSLALGMLNATLSNVGISPALRTRICPPPMSSTIMRSSSGLPTTVTLTFGPARVIGSSPA